MKKKTSSEYMRPRAVHFNELNGQPLPINDHIKYEN
jgi:hypothetical protein